MYLISHDAQHVGCGVLAEVCNADDQQSDWAGSTAHQCSLHRTLRCQLAATICQERGHVLMYCTHAQADEFLLSKHTVMAVLRDRLQSCSVRPQLVCIVQGESKHESHACNVCASRRSCGENALETLVWTSFSSSVYCCR